MEMSALKNVLGIWSLIVTPLPLQGPLRAAASRCSPCPSDLDCRYPASPDSKPVELVPECQLDASRIALRWMSAAAVEPKCKRYE